MAIDPEVIPHSSKKGNRAYRHTPKWAIYSSAGIGVFLFVGFIKVFFPFIGMAVLLAYIWAQSTSGFRS